MSTCPSLRPPHRGISQWTAPLAGRPGGRRHHPSLASYAGGRRATTCRALEQAAKRKHIHAHPELGRSRAVANWLCVFFRAPFAPASYSAATGGRGSAEARWSSERLRGARAEPGLVRPHKAQCATAARGTWLQAAAIATRPLHRRTQAACAAGRSAGSVAEA